MVPQLVGQDQEPEAGRRHQHRKPHRRPADRLTEPGGHQHAQDHGDGVPGIGEVAADDRRGQARRDPPADPRRTPALGYRRRHRSEHRERAIAHPDVAGSGNGDRQPADLNRGGKSGGHHQRRADMTDHECDHQPDGAADAAPQEPAGRSGRATRNRADRRPRLTRCPAAFPRVRAPSYAGWCSRAGR